MTAPPPRAPTFPSLDADPVRVIDDIDDDAPAASPQNTAFHTPVRTGATPTRAPPAMSASSAPGAYPAAAAPAASSAASSSSTSASSATPSAAFSTPVSGAGVGRSGSGRGYRTRLGAILTWKDPKVSAVALAMCLLFFYFTMWKQYSILSVCGAALGLYLTIGLIVVNINKMTGNTLDRFIKRPVHSTPVFRKESAYRLADTLVEEGNELAEEARHILYCDDTSLTTSWIGVAFFIYVIGRSFSLLPVLFLFTLGLFTLPIAYEKNKKLVDDTLAHAQVLASKHFESGRQVAGEHAYKVYDLAAERSAPLLAKSPALKNMADKVGFTPSKARKNM